MPTLARLVLSGSMAPTNTTGVFISAAFLNTGRMAVGAMGMVMMPSTLEDEGDLDLVDHLGRVDALRADVLRVESRSFAASSKPARATSHTGGR